MGSGEPFPYKKRHGGSRSAYRRAPPGGGSCAFSQARDRFTVGATRSSIYGEKTARNDVLSMKYIVYLLQLLHISFPHNIFSQYQVSPRATPPRRDTNTNTTSSRTPTFTLTNGDNVNLLHKTHLLHPSTILSLKPASSSWPPFAHSQLSRISSLSRLQRAARPRHTTSPKHIAASARPCTHTATSPTTTCPAHAPRAYLPCYPWPLFVDVSRHHPLLQSLFKPLYASLCSIRASAQRLQPLEPT